MRIREIALIIDMTCADCLSARSNTRDTLQDTARAQFENNKRIRRQVFAQAAERGTEWPADSGKAIPSPVSIRQRYRGGSESFRMRSGSGGSRTATSESDLESPSFAGKLSNSPNSSPSHRLAHLPSGGSSNLSQPYGLSSASSTSTYSIPNSATSALSPIATRMLERDADAMEKYKMRNRSGSAGTTSTEILSQNGSSTVASLNEEDMLPLNAVINGSVPARRLLRPSASAAQLRSNAPSVTNPPSLDMIRTRSGTNPKVSKSPPADGNSFSGSQSTVSSRPTVIPEVPFPEDDDYSGPSEKYAQFPQPPLPQPGKPPERKGSSGLTTPTSTRRLPFSLLSKPLPSIDPQISHRRGASTAS